MTDIVVLDEFRDWYNALDDQTAEDVTVGVTLLEERGVTLMHPYSSAIKGSKLALRELRIQSKGRPIRVLYAFDPARQAVLLLAGDKTGDDRFYERMIPRAESLWARYLEGL